MHGRRNARQCLLILGSLFCVSLGVCQDTPEVSFTLDFPGSDPSHYVISVYRDRHGSYRSNGKLSADSNSSESDLAFSVSRETTQRIFDLAKQSHYFDGKIDSGKKRLAFTGAKLLSYRAGDKASEAQYNYSPLPAVQELTTMFQSFSTTLEFGRRLSYELQYQKLALDDELKKLEGFANQRHGIDLSPISPVLEQIANDSTLLNVVRARAQRLAKADGRQF